MKLDINEFNKLSKDGYLRKSEKENLVSFKYTDKTTYEKNWNEITRKARGIVLEKETGEVICFAPEKFFNVFEMPETTLINLPKEDFVITEKMDGSAGLIYNYNDEWRVNTLGSFGSDQAIKASEMLLKYDLSRLNKNINLFVEIIYPENKIVVNYGKDEKLILITAYHRSSGKEISYSALNELSRLTNIPQVSEFRFTIDELINIQKELPKDNEGYVVRFESGLRVKFKGDEYCRVHKMISNMTPLAFWESMEDGIVRQDYVQQLPEEFRAEADKLSNQLQNKYTEIFVEITKDMAVLNANVNINIKKDVGLFVQNPKNGLKHAKAMFHIINLNKKALDKHIMNIIRPTNNTMVE